MQELIKEVHDLRLQMTGVSTPSINDIIASSVPAIVVDLQTRIIVHSTRLADELFGYMEGELQGKDINDIIPERFHALHDKHVVDYSAHPSSRTMGTHKMQLIGKMRDGKEINVEIGLHPRAIGGKRYVVATPVKINGK